MPLINDSANAVYLEIRIFFHRLSLFSTRNLKKFTIGMFDNDSLALIQFEKLYDVPVQNMRDTDALLSQLLSENNLWFTLIHQLTYRISETQYLLNYLFI